MAVVGPAHATHPGAPGLGGEGRAVAREVVGPVTLVTENQGALGTGGVLVNPLLPSVLNIARLTKILISIKEGIIKKNSYERRAYESVDD